METSGTNVKSGRIQGSKHTHKNILSSKKSLADQITPQYTERKDLTTCIHNNKNEQSNSSKTRVPDKKAVNSD
ncbi:hypothetical protein PCANC_26782 [Puccinia coronata f. sp. avenae]|nr:hypothetical protein PCANC_26782 [Puccinia coronata f. sp. avenae]PLW23476.1 hypothetical protein PCASD_13637 [Puccinia coronata f. sp. avenae]PLW34221.1 hypothetical protein PCASD_15039 [Puccinia coronata f. sp. avenae]